MPTKSPYDIGGGVIGTPRAAPINTPGLIAKGAPSEAYSSWLNPSTQLTGTQDEWFNRYRNTMNAAGPAPTGITPKKPTLGGGGGGGAGVVVASLLRR
jgi:hypothetical protein